MSTATRNPLQSFGSGPQTVSDDRFWSDWVNPLLIKELRQGLRDRMFIFSLFGMQYFMAFLVIFQLFSNDQGQSDLSGIFRMVMWFAFVGVLPIRGFFSYSVANEIKQNTLESLLLSRMGARGIVFGKWISLVFQSFLAVVIMMPFMIIQYWVGGTDIATNVQELITAFFLNGILSALAIGISCIQFSFMRFGSLFGVGFGAYYLWTSLNESAIPVFMQDLLVLSIAGFFIVPFIVLEIASVYLTNSDSAPLTRRLSYLTIFIGGWCYFQSADVGSLLSYGLLFTLVCFLEAFQPLGLIPPNSPRGLSRFIACFFSQTPLSGLIFTTVSVPLLAFFVCYSQAIYSMVILSSPRNPWIVQFTGALFYANFILAHIYLPLFIVELFLKRYSTRLFVVGLVTLGIYGCIMLGFTDLSQDSTWWGMISTDPFIGDEAYRYDLAIATLLMFLNVIGFNALSLLYLKRMKRT